MDIQEYALLMLLDGSMCDIMMAYVIRHMIGVSLLSFLLF